MLSATAAALAVALAAAAPTPAAPVVPTSAVDTRPPCVPEGMSDKTRRANRRVAIAGGVVFAVFYGAASAVAASELDATRHAEDTPAVRDRRRVAYLSLFPVAGPLVASPIPHGKGDRAGLVGFALMQSLGLAMLSIGLSNLARDRRHRRVRLEMTGGIARHGGGLGLRARF